MVFIVKYMEIPFDTIPHILSWSLAFDLTACWKFGREIDTGTQGFNFYPMGTLSLLGGKINCSGNTVEPASKCWLFVYYFKPFHVSALGWLKDWPSNLLGGHSNNWKASWWDDGLPSGRIRVFKSFHLYGMTKLPSSCSAGNSFFLWRGGLWLARELTVETLKRIRVLNGKK